jgi:hypothetical protein
LDHLEQNNQNIQENNSLLAAIAVKGLNLKGDITSEEFKEFQTLLQEAQTNKNYY